MKRQPPSLSNVNAPLQRSLPLGMHWRKRPPAILRMAKEQSGRQFIFAISKNGRRDNKSIPDDPADRMTACINLRVDVFNDDASAYHREEAMACGTSKESTAATELGRKNA